MLRSWIDRLALAAAMGAMLVSMACRDEWAEKMKNAPLAPLPQPKPAATPVEQPLPPDLKPAVDVPNVPAGRDLIILLPQGEVFVNSVIEARAAEFQLNEQNAMDIGFWWTINGRQFTTQPFLTLNCAEQGVRRGDVIQARAMFNNQEVFSRAAIVANSKPRLVRVQLLPDRGLRPGDRLAIDAKADDADGDPVMITYEWMLNEATAGNEATLGRSIQRGDKVSVAIRTNDGIEDGQSTRLDRTVSNFSPVFEQSRAYSIKGGVYMYKALAADPEGDPVTYSLKNAPEGATIESNSGEVTWRVPNNFTGKADFTIIATDGKGGLDSILISNYFVNSAIAPPPR